MSAALTATQYLEIERAADFCSEFHDGVMYEGADSFLHIASLGLEFLLAEIYADLE